MSQVGQRERTTQNRLVAFFQNELGYRYLGNWHDRVGNKNIETDLLVANLKKRGVSEALINRAIRQLDTAAALGEGKKLYYANQDVYGLLRYGVKDKEGAGEQNQTVWLIDWHNPEVNDFAIAEEVSIKGENKKRPDLVLYVNGIALGVLELKRSSVSVTEGIRQNLDNQKKDFIRNFFTTVQLVMAGNDTQGLRYSADIPHPLGILLIFNHIFFQLIDFECLFFEGAECRTVLLRRLRNIIWNGKKNCLMWVSISWIFI